MQLARLLRGAAAEKKAWDPVVIDVRDQTSVADYFVICEGETDRQVPALLWRPGLPRPRLCL
ncbi:MAG: hypothetical protein E6I29_06390 [Chloroflexi bacterium]|nr:MAG: hypothetical protein E6I29_06390 [Chloroflexota bacterium]